MKNTYTSFSERETWPERIGNIIVWVSIDITLLYLIYNAF